MDKQPEKQEPNKTEWMDIVLPIATFIIGSWLVPKMSWIPDAIKVWSFTIGVWLLLVSICFKWLRTQIHNKVGVIIVSLILCACLGLWLNFMENSYVDNEQLQIEVNSLVTEINQFVADRALSHPTATDNKWTSPEEWFQASRNYDMQTDNLFVTRYRQRIVNLGYELREKNVITDEELQHLNWVNQPDYPVIRWSLEELEKYNARLK